jgi:hypothetical protein
MFKIEVNNNSCFLFWWDKHYNALVCGYLMSFLLFVSLMCWCSWWWMKLSFVGCDWCTLLYVDFWCRYVVSVVSMVGESSVCTCVCKRAHMCVCVGACWCGGQEHSKLLFSYIRCIKLSITVSWKGSYEVTREFHMKVSSCMMDFVMYLVIFPLLSSYFILNIS